MTKSKKGLFITLSIIAFAVVLGGVFLFRFIISYPLVSNDVLASSDFEDFATLSLDPYITFIPEELRGGSTSPTYVVTDPTLGDENAPTKLVIFSDMVSEAAGLFTPEIVAVAERNPEIVELTWKDFPIPRLYGSSLIAAQAARCAQAQDEGAFWQMRSKIFTNRENVNEALLNELAVELGLNSDNFDYCLDSDETLRLIQRNYLEAKFLGLDIPPVLFINGEEYTGIYSYNDILEFINQLIQ